MSRLTDRAIFNVVDSRGAILVISAGTTSVDLQITVTDVNGASYTTTGPGSPATQTLAAAQSIHLPIAATHPALTVGPISVKIESQNGGLFLTHAVVNPLVDVNPVSGAHMQGDRFFIPYVGVAAGQTQKLRIGVTPIGVACDVTVADARAGGFSTAPATVQPLVTWVWDSQLQAQALTSDGLIEVTATAPVVVSVHATRANTSYHVYPAAASQ